MMTAVSVRELKLEIDQYKQLHQTTHRRLVSVNSTKVENAGREWVELDSLAAEIGANWKSGISATKAISQGRR